MLSEVNQSGKHEFCVKAHRMVPGTSWRKFAGMHFTKVLCAHNWNLINITIRIIIILIVQLVYNFAHVTTAQLAWYVRNCDLISQILASWFWRDLDYELLNPLKSTGSSQEPFGRKTVQIRHITEPKIPRDMKIMLCQQYIGDTLSSTWPQFSHRGKPNDISGNIYRVLATNHKCDVFVEHINHIHLVSNWQWRRNNRSIHWLYLDISV